MMSLIFDIADSPLIIWLPKGAESPADSSLAADSESVSRDKQMTKIACHFPDIQEEVNGD